jgi:hypothetical protein
MIRAHVTRHATERWMERVEPELVRADAAKAIVDFLAEAEVSEHPPAWVVQPPPKDALFATNSKRPGVAVMLGRARGYLGTRTVLVAGYDKPPREQRVDMYRRAAGRFNRGRHVRRARNQLADALSAESLRELDRLAESA